MIKVCLAVGDKAVENWLKNKLKNQVVFGRDAVYRDMILSVVADEMPDVIVVKEKLPGNSSNAIGGKPMSMSLIMHKIRTLYQRCRIVLIAGNHTPGDKFLSAMVDMRIYDIVYGEVVKIPEVADMILHPRDYSYASRLQKIDIFDDSGDSVEESKLVDEVPNPDYQNSKRKQKNTVVKNTATPVGAAPSSVAYTNQNNYHVNNYKREDYNGGYVQPAADTSVLSSGTSGTKPGIIFTRLEQVQSNSYSNYVENENTILVDYSQTYGNNLPATYNNAQTPYYNTNNYPMVSYQNYNYKMSKITVFTSVRQGVGCTSCAINTAISLAKEGRKVLLIDGVVGFTSIFKKLGISTNGMNFDDLINEFMNGRGITNLTINKSVISANSPRYNCFPDTLHYLQLSDSVNYMSELKMVQETVKELSKVFDNIIIDTCLGIGDKTTRDFLTIADIVVYVLTQDLYELNKSMEFLQIYDSLAPFRQKMMCVVNKYIKSVSPSLKDISDYFTNCAITTVACDMEGFLGASLVGVGYYSDGKKKIIKSFDTIASYMK